MKKQNTEKKRFLMNIAEATLAAVALTLQLKITAGLWQILLFMLCLAFLQYTKTGKSTKAIGYPLSVFLSVTLIVGACYYENESIFAWLATPVEMGIILLGNSLLVMWGVNWCIQIWNKMAAMQWSNKITEWLFGNKCIYKIWAVLLIFWVPVIGLSFPGNMNADAVRQIEQVLGIVPYSGHHPLFSTLLIGGIIKMGHAVFGSYDVALFLYVCLQSAALAFALTQTILVLQKKGASHTILLCLLGIYILSPIYSNITSTVIKDVPFMVAVIVYIIMWTEICTSFENLKNKKFLFIFCVIQVLVILLRNNGIYMLLISHVLFMASQRRELLTQKVLKRSLLILFLPILVGILSNSFLMHILDANSGSRREMLSLFFQQTARYIGEYEEEITTEEAEIIDAILTDTISVARNYDPNIADPVKVLYKDNASSEDHIQYFKLWVKWFFRHPKVYFDAFFAHIYGWFCPLIANEIRYVGESDIFSRKELFPGADQMLVVFYQRLDAIAPLGFLENVGVYTWILFILSNIVWRGDKKKIAVFFPLYVSLLVCVLSPCFFLHPRYAFPIMFTIPFLMGFLSLGKNNGDCCLDSKIIEEA